MTAEVSMNITSQASGNTNPEANVFKCPKKRAFLLTFNENAVVNCMKAVEHFKKLKTCDYLICCKKYNKAGNEHCHLYVHFNNMYAIANKLITSTKMHIDIPYGSPKQNIEYVRKDGYKWESKREYQKTQIMEEYGIEPRQGQMTIKELREVENSDDLPDWKQYNVWKQVRNEHKKTKVHEWHKDVEVLWIQGPSGIGKSKKVVEICDEKGIEEFDEVKHDGEHSFWLNADSAGGCCVYDDFRDSHMKASEFINFIDYNVHNMRILGGFARNNYNTIIITTVQDINEIYANLSDEPKKQWLRRVKVIDLYKEQAESKQNNDNGYIEI
nr:replication-associated protein [Cressdnaviricota sp.]